MRAVGCEFGVEKMHLLALEPGGGNSRGALQWRRNNFLFVALARDLNRK
jgi:hypothetical protein